MMEVSSNCPFCNNKPKRINFGFSLFRNFNWEGKRKFFCYNCQVVFMHPQFNEKTINEFYKSGYRDNLLPKISLKIDFNWMDVSFSRHKNLIEIDKELDLNGKEILDLGGYQGAFAYGIKKNFPNSSITVSDFDPRGLEFASNYFNLKTVNTEVLFKSNLKYDFVSLVHVLEHVPNPKEYLKKVKHLLNDNSKIYIEVPNWINFPFTDKSHLYDFSSFFLIKLLSEIGFGNIKVSIHGNPKFNTPTYVNNSVISLIATVNENPLNFNGRKISLKNLKFQHFRNDIILIFRTLKNTLLMFFKHLLYLVFSIFSFFFPKTCNWFLKKINR